MNNINPITYVAIIIGDWLELPDNSTFRLPPIADSIYNMPIANSPIFALVSVCCLIRRTMNTPTINTTIRNIDCITLETKGNSYS